MDRPSSFQSFADYLGLNEQALKEMQDAAAERAEKANYDALGSLWQAENDARNQSRQSGTGSLSSQASYQEYLKKRREAEEMRRPTGPMSAREAALRGMRPVENRFARDWKATEAQSQSAVEGQNRAYFAEQERLAAEKAAKEAAAAEWQKKLDAFSRSSELEELAVLFGDTADPNSEIGKAYQNVIGRYGTAQGAYSALANRAKTMGLRRQAFTGLEGRAEKELPWMQTAPRGTAMTLEDRRRLYSGELTKRHSDWVNKNRKP